MAEFCPATLHYAAVKGSPMYGLALAGESSRSVIAALAFDTSSGWYAVQTAVLPLTKRYEHYHSTTTSYVRHTFLSQRFFVRFPPGTTIRHAFVASAKSTGDAAWDAKGQVTCVPTLDLSDGMFPEPLFTELDPKDAIHLEAAPVSGEAIYNGAPIQAPYDEKSCAHPFVRATPTTSPDFNADPQFGYFDHLSVGTRVLIDAGGTVRDAEIDSPSGIQSVDSEMLRLSEQQHYTGAIAYCMPVPSYALYVFEIDR